MSKKEPLPNPNSVNMIANSTEFVGDLMTDSDIKFDGKLTGKIITKSKLVIGESGEIDGEVHCKSAVVSGKIKGKIFVEDIIMLQSSSDIEGDIFTSKIAIESGAILNGTCKMGEDNSQSKIHPTVEK